jgi:hypothetical protein
LLLLTFMAVDRALEVHKATLQQEIEALQHVFAALMEKRKATPHRITV